MVYTYNLCPVTFNLYFRSGHSLDKKGSYRAVMNWQMVLPTRVMISLLWAIGL